MRGMEIKDSPLQPYRNGYSLNPQALATFHIQIYNHSVEPNIVLCSLKSLRNKCEKPIYGFPLIHSNYRIHRPGHSNVGYISSTSRKDPFIRRLNVCMRAYYSTYLSIEIPSHSYLLRCRLGMKINDYELSLLS